MEGATAPLAARSLHSFAACLCAATPFEKTKTNKQANKEVPHRDYFTHVSVFFFPQTRQFSHCLYYYYYYVTPFFLPLLWGGDFFTSFLSPFSTLLVSLVFFFSFFFTVAEGRMAVLGWDKSNFEYDLLKVMVIGHINTWRRGKKKQKHT